MEIWSEDVESIVNRLEVKKKGKEGRHLLFIGSSSIRRWKNLAKDFPEYNTMNAGFGGSYLSEVNYYLERILEHVKVDAVILYAGENDLQSGCSTPEIVLKELHWFHHNVNRLVGDIPILALSIKPTFGPGTKGWKRVERYNKLLGDYANVNPGVFFVDVWGQMLTSEGKLNKNLYAEDGIHLARSGYQIWQQEISATLSMAFKDYSNMPEQL